MGKISSPSMLVWQLERLMGQLMLVGDHYADSTCPCTFGFSDPSGTYVGENCIPKHLLAIYEYATETHPMAGDEKLKEILLTIADEARQIRELEKKKLCGEEVNQRDITNWSRDNRKLLEPFIYDMACQIPKPTGEEVEMEEAPAPPQSEGEFATLEQLQDYPVCMGLEKARDIHEHYIGLPPDPKTGSIEWHEGWVDLYNRALQTCGCRGKESMLEEVLLQSAVEKPNIEWCGDGLKKDNFEWCDSQNHEGNKFSDNGCNSGHSNQLGGRGIV